MWTISPRGKKFFVANWRSPPRKASTLVPSGCGCASSLRVAWWKSNTLGQAQSTRPSSSIKKRWVIPEGSYCPQSCAFEELTPSDVGIQEAQSHIVAHLHNEETQETNENMDRSLEKASRWTPWLAITKSVSQQLNLPTLVQEFYFENILSVMLWTFTWDYEHNGEHRGSEHRGSGWNHGGNGSFDHLRRGEDGSACMSHLLLFLFF